MKRGDASDTDLATVKGIFPNLAEAQRAVDALRAAGYQDDQINLLVASDADVSNEDTREHELEADRVLVTVHAVNAAHARDILDQLGTISRPSPGTAVPGNALPATPY